MLQRVVLPRSIKLSAYSSETQEIIYQIARRYNVQNSNVHNHSHENVKSIIQK
jgi:hypothetical protein